MQKVRRHPTWGLRPLVGNKFQILFHSLNKAAFHLSGATQEHPKALQDFEYRAITFYGRTFQSVLLSIQVPCWSPTTPPR